MAALVAETLASRHRVTVLAGRPSYDPDERYPAQLLRREERNGVTIERVGSTDYPRHRMGRRVANYLSYTALAMPRALALRADLILSMTDPPFNGITGAAVSRLSGRPLVYNIRDLYPEMAIGGDIVRPGLFARGWESLHRRALRRASRVIVLGDDMRERILAKGVAPERVVVVRDGTTIPEGTPPCANHPVAQEIRGGHSFVVLHAGNLGFYGAWDTLVRAAQILGNDGVGLVFVGDGANRPRVEAAALECPQVRFLPFRPVEQIPYVMAAGDLHVVTVRRGLEGVVVPSKLYSILAAGRPVLAVASKKCDAVRIVREAGCGVAADPDDPAAVAETIRKLRAAPEQLTAMGRRAREVAKRFLRADELERLINIVEDAARDR